MVSTQSSSKHADDASVMSTKSAMSVKSVKSVKITAKEHEIFNNDQTQELKEIASAMAATVSISEADASKPGREDSSMFSKKSTKSSSSKVSTKSDASKVSMKSSSSKKNKDAAAPSKIEEECGCVNDVVEQVEQRE